MKIAIFIFGMMAFGPAAFADDLFYEINSDLTRPGIKELKRMATSGFISDNYRLGSDFVIGYGDTLKISLWGRVEGSYKLTVDRDGNVTIPMIGKITVMGMDMKDAYTAVKREIDKKFSNVEFDLNLVDARDIQISILGEVENPGTYSVSPFCRLAEAVVKAGGLSKDGCMTDIRVLRDNREVESFNIYNFLFNADQSKNARLKQGDVVFVPRAQAVMAIRGDVKSPGIYEMNNGNRLSHLINMAGGISVFIKTDMKAYILRINPATKSMEVFKETRIEPDRGVEPKDDETLENYDTVVVTNVFDYTAVPTGVFKKVLLDGEIKSPGTYLIKEGETLGSLIERAGGIKDTAHTEGIVFTRESIKEQQRSFLEDFVRAQERSILEEEISAANAALNQEDNKLRRGIIERKRKALNIIAARRPGGRIIIDNLEDVISGKFDMALENGDHIYIPVFPNWVLVAGEVYNPESVIFVKDRPMEYYVNAVGGPTKNANKDDIYIIKANGCVKSKATGYSNVSAGDIVVVPAKQ